MVKKRDCVCFSCDVYSRMIWILSEFCFLQAKTLTARRRGQNNLKGHPSIFFFIELLRGSKYRTAPAKHCLHFC